MVGCSTRVDSEKLCMLILAPPTLAILPPVTSHMFSNAPCSVIPRIETPEMLLGSLERLRWQHMQSCCQVQQGNRSAARATFHTMNHHLHATGMHLLDKIQRQVYHLLLNEQGDGQIKQTQHQPVFSSRHQVLRMVSWQAPTSVP